MKLFNIIEKKKYFLIITWLSFFFSINLNPIEFLDYNYLNKIRLVLPFILTVITIIIFLNKIKLSTIFEIPFIFFYIILFMYIFFNLNNLSNNNSLNLFWPLSMFLSLFILQVLTNSDEKVLLLKFTLLIIILGFLFYFISGITYTFAKGNYHFYGILGSNLDYSGLKNPPRSSGLARLSLIIFVHFTIFYMFKKKNNYYLLFLISLFALITLLFNSRTSSFIFLVINLLFVIFYYKKFFFDKKLIIFSLLMPLILNFFYSVFINNSTTTDNKTLTEFLKFDKSEIVSISKSSIFRETNDESFSSGRFENWNAAYNIIRNNPLKGYGAQADRIFINQSIHNAFLYSVLSGGLVSGILISLLYIYSLYLLILLFFRNKFQFNDDYILNFCGCLIIILSLRSILESSFAVFSIDYLLYIISLIVLKNKLKKKKIEL